MRTLIVSDLHFGSVSRADVLRLPQVQVALLDALADVDRLVLLGDVLELRHGPRRDALKAARPFFEALGKRMADCEIVLTAGNHDHALLDGWFARRGESERPEALTLNQRIAPGEASGLAAMIAQWAAPAEVSLAFPGLWVREDVYAIHGHYLDCHITVPTLERLAIGLMGAMLRKGGAALASVEDYEAVTAPIYAWIDATAAQGATRAALNGSATVRMWRALGGDKTSSRRSWGGMRSLSAIARSRRPAAGRAWRAEAARRAFPIAVSALNRAGLGPLSADISGPQLRKAALIAMAQVAARLELRDCAVVFGHTHRAGPLQGDSEEEWQGLNGVRLFNSGSWTWSPTFAGGDPRESPYWPGACVRVQGQAGESPEVLRLLLDRSEADLQAVHHSSDRASAL